MPDSILQKISEKPASPIEVIPDILLLQLSLVNVIMVGDPNSMNGEWALIGTGLAHTGKDIVKAAENRFGKGIQPSAIILTHGHFDHVGAIMELTSQWSSPVYAHPLEMPYLTGQKDYPPADPTADGGLIARISPVFTHKGINLGTRVQPLPGDGTVPGMPGWRWIHTPGHTPGHISLFRESDRVLIAGDAVTTVKQESAEAVLSQEKELNGPPAYFTIDWQAAKESIKTIKNLKPALLISSHGLPMNGKELENQLEKLVNSI